MARQSYSDEMKRNLRQHYRNNSYLTQADLVKWFKKTYKKPLRQALVSLWLSNRFAYLDGITKATTTKRRPSLYPELDKALFEWYSKIEEGRWVRPNEIIEEAKMLWPKIYPNKNQPQFSTGWLNGFRNRYKAKNIYCGIDSGSSTANNISQLEKIKKKMEEYSPEEIYRCDETGMFFNDFQSKGSAAKIHKGGEYSYKRMTVYLCCNGDGSDKLIPWIIANAQIPGVSRDEVTSPKCIWRRSINSWMNTSQMVEWLMNFDKNAERRIFPLPFEKKKMLLLLDDFSAHRKAVELCTASSSLKNTEVCFLPPPTAPETPLPHGFVQKFRDNYRESIGSYAIDQYDSGCKDLNKMSISDSVNWTVAAWAKVSRSAIRYTWNKSKIFYLTFEKEILDADKKHLGIEKKENAARFVKICSKLDKRQLLIETRVLDYTNANDGEEEEEDSQENSEEDLEEDQEESLEKDPEKKKSREFL